MQLFNADRITKILIKITIGLCLCLTPAESDKWNCSLHGPRSDFKLDKLRMSGVWYEVIRIPGNNIPACVTVTASSTIVANSYQVQVDYIENIRDKWTPKVERLEFPWNDAVNGIFDITYGSVAVNFVLMDTDYQTYAIVCGYSNAFSKIAFFKLLTRQRQSKKDFYQQMVMKLLNDTGGDQTLFTSVSTVEQSCKCSCNDPASISTALTFMIAAFYGINKLFC